MSSSNDAPQSQAPSPPLLLSSLTLFPATKAQVYESRKRTFTQWGRGVTLEQYLERDARSDVHEVSRDGRLVTWVLARRDDPEGLDFLCSCETFKRDGVVVKPLLSQAEPVACYGIASVFTPPQNRKKGYARHMMRLLHWVLSPRSALPESFPTEVWGEIPGPQVWRNGNTEQVLEGHGGNAAFSVLFSDIGSEFYAKCGPMFPGPEEGEGWLVREPISTEWVVDNLFAALASRGDETKSEGWEWLDEKRVYEMWNVDADGMKAEMTDSLAASNANSGRVLFAFLPDKGVAEFQVDRLRYFWQKVEPKPIHWGVYKRPIEGSGGLDPSTFASWTLDVRLPEANVMIITRLRAKPAEFEGLLREVAGFAKRHRVEKIEVWGLGEELRGMLGGKTFDRDEHLPSFKWYGDEKDLNWCFNEKFCWC